MERQIVDLKQSVEVLTFSRRHVNDADSHALLVSAQGYLERQIAANAVKFTNPQPKGAENMNATEPTRVRQQGTIVTNPSTPEERIAAIRQIVTACQYAKVDGVMVDLFTALAIVKVYDALSAENRAKFTACDVRKMVSIAFKLITKGSDGGRADFRQGRI